MMSAIGDIPMRVQTPEDLGLLIRDRRQQLQLDQGELARRARVSRQWLIEMEQGKARKEVGLVLRTLQALELHLFVEPANAVAPEGSASDLLDAVLDASGDRGVNR
jgi:HTH-type transcriptional regulator/antitoxin HipB